MKGVRVVRVWTGCRGVVFSQGVGSKGDGLYAQVMNVLGLGSLRDELRIKRL